jgi:hypothetical protein
VSGISLVGVETAPAISRIRPTVLVRVVGNSLTSRIL